MRAGGRVGGRSVVEAAAAALAMHIARVRHSSLELPPALQNCESVRPSDGLSDGIIPCTHRYVVTVSVLWWSLLLAAIVFSCIGRRLKAFLFMLYSPSRRPPDFATRQMTSERCCASSCLDTIAKVNDDDEELQS